MDAFIDVMIKIAKEVEENPDVVLEAPHTTIIGRLDEVQAARNPVLRYCKEDAASKEPVKA